MIRRRVLVVDDEPQIQQFLRVALTAADYDIIAAATGTEALKLAATMAPDVVVLDLGLPDRDGKDVLRDLRMFSKVSSCFRRGTAKPKKLQRLIWARTTILRSRLALAN